MPMAHQTSDRFTSSDSAEVFNVLVLDSDNNLANPNALANKDLVTVGSLRDGSHQSGFMPPVVDSKTTYLSNSYQFYQEAHTQGSLLPYVNAAEDLDNGFHDIYNETASLGFHGFGHTPQTPQGAYTPVSSYPPPVGDTSRLSNARHFVTLDSSYHQPSVPQNIPHVTSKGQISHLEFPVNIEQQQVGKRFGLRPNYLPQSGSFGGGSNFFGSSSSLCSLYQASDRFAVRGFCSDWSNPFNGKSSLFHPSYPAASNDHGVV
ncbi:hypothetical protein HRI_000753800 [Hibiscus trionum]|uniref:Uncharacterized protein n=1 Tax=Hibiscus trionum TaxID=183268 RepID=A0A9W7H4G2_HIBTR|nr:hypothetical protein HRI_000753800 [Hibiscus trionum]